MRQAGRPAVISGVLGVVGSVLLSVAVLLPFGFAANEAIFIGLVLASYQRQHLRTNPHRIGRLA